MRGFRGLSTPDGWVWVEGEKPRFAAHLHGLPPGPYRVTTSPDVPDRTLEQNALQWKWESIVSEHLGWSSHDKDAVHDFILGDIYGWKEQQSPIDGHIRVVPVRRTRHMSIPQMTKHLDRLKHWAWDKHQITLTTPSDLTDDDLAMGERLERGE